MKQSESLSLEDIKKLPPQEAITCLDKFIKIFPDKEEAYLIRGMKHWNLNHRREAINDYLKAINLNPDSKAKALLQYANSILDYYNKDLLNP